MFPGTIIDYLLCRNLHDCLEEVHGATLSDERTTAMFYRSGIVPIGHKLCVLVWDSRPIKMQRPRNLRHGRQTFSGKVKGNCATLLSACDLEGKPVFTLPVSPSISPNCTDESLGILET